ncbi:pantoate--beta-alanine ligase [Pseudogemmobacter sonorensis]|uniref:pantoate--beta-alanine ligase n=1 Tax=Pseudogemmobacter sonorensis TaxID=2989681 RepID=UPI00369CA3C4
MTEIIHAAAELRSRVRAWRAAGEMVGVVPTMGALHEGHLSLARRARRECDRVITTIFVNPTQFNNPDDLQKYPRTLEADAALLSGVPVDVVFAPSVDEIYPEGFVTRVSVGGVSEPLEGQMRPGHFDGVATVVTKLFGMTEAHRAYFGQKDWQQLQVVSRLARDLNLPVAVVGCETVREADGLAMSSRNRRLSAPARANAPRLHAAMTAAAEEIRAGQPERQAIRDAGAAVLRAGFERVEYIELRDAETLLTSEDPGRPRRMLAAAWIEGVRLIDNIPV